MNRIYPAHTVIAARELRATGMTHAAIGGQLAAPATTVRAWLANVCRVRPALRRINENAPRWSHADTAVAEARALKKSGMRGTDIARSLCIPYPTVRDWLRGPTRAGRPTGRPAPHTLES